MKILKFGGTSVGSAPVIQSVRDIVLRSVEAGEEPIVVVSALGGVTNLLLKAGETAALGSKGYTSVLEEIINRHNGVISGLFEPVDAVAINNELKPLFDELEKLLYGIHLIHELSPKSKDKLLSFGELFSAKIVSRVISAAGCASVFIDAREIIVTGDSFGNALVDHKVTDELIRAKLPLSGSVAVVTGFIARNGSGETTTLGRGGSDYTAAIVGAALQADEIQIWTDVDGFMTADPRKVKKALPIEEISFEEALEMTSFGAKVIYPPTIRPAYLKSVPISIRNTFVPTARGTVITGTGQGRSFLLTGISSLSSVVLVKIEGSSLGDNSGLAGKVLSIVGGLQVPVYLSSQASAGNSIVLCLPRERVEEVEAKLRAELRYELHFGIVGDISVEKNVSVVTIFAENMRCNSSIPGRIFAALGKNGISIKAISQGASRINLSLVVAGNDEKKALNVVHDEFFLSNRKTLNLLVAGTGPTGRTLFQKIRNQQEFLSRESGLEVKI